MPQYSFNERSVGRALDLLCIGIAEIASRGLIRWLSARGLFIYPYGWSSQYWPLLLIAIVSWLSASTYTRLYRTSPLTDVCFNVRGLVRVLCLYGLIAIGSLFVLKVQNVSRQFMFYTLMLSGCGISLRHCLASSYHARLRRFGYDWRTALVVGTNEQCRRFAHIFRQNGPYGYRIIASPTDMTKAFGVNDSESLDLSEADDAFVLPNGSATGRTVLRLLKEGKAVHLVPSLFDAGLFRRTLGDLGGAPIVSICSGRLTKLEVGLKRLADIAGSLFLLAILSPVFLVIALLIKLTSNGPIWFNQKRLGRGGKPFNIYKFRTMVADAEEVLRTTPGLYEQYVANNYKLPKERDPRITRLGGFLRATSLDELPQLLNVLKGEMSLVGPRPIVVAEVEKYDDYAGLFLSAKPGMTGHWQVSGRSDVEDYRKRVELDLEYLRDQSLGKDVEILLRTVPSVLLRKGAH